MKLNHKVYLTAAWLSCIGSIHPQDAPSTDIPAYESIDMNSEEGNQQKRIPIDVGDTFAQKMATFEQRAQEAQIDLDRIEQESTHPFEVKSDELVSKSWFPQNFYSNQPNHSINSIGKKSIEIENGARFEIPEKYAHIISQWAKNTPIEITLDYGWFWRCEYRIWNMVTGEYVSANLEDGPFKNHERTFYITALDPVHRTVWIRNFQNTYSACYEISPANSDAQIFSQWHVGNSIIEAKTGNSSWFPWGNSHDIALINVNHNNSVTAKRLQ